MSDEQVRDPTPDPTILSRLAGGLAHELKNPLSTLSLQLGVMREEWAEVDDTRARRTVRTLDSLLEEVGRLNEILEDFLLYSRADTVELEEADLNSVVESVVRFVTPEANARGISIRTFLDVDLPPLPLDPTRFRQVLLNLLINARQALSQKGGQITVITRREGDEAVVEVVDDGPGMSREVLDRCFEVYFSTKKGGSGLGLATVRRVTEAHGGRVEVESEAGHGTRFRLRMPLT